MRIALKNIKDYPWYLRPFFWAQRKKYGAPLNSSLLWARSPRIFLGLSHLFGAIDRKSSPISSALRSLIIVRVSQLNSCSFCVDLNASVLLKRGVSIEKVQVLHQWQTSPLFSEQEKISLAYAEAVTLGNEEMNNEMIMKLKQYFNDDEIIELTALIAFQNMSTKFNTALDIPPQGFCRVTVNKADKG